MDRSRRTLLKGVVALGGLALAGPICWLDERPKPTSVSMPFATGGVVPASTRWILCDGCALPRSQYAELFKVFGTTFGSGDGVTTFNLPSMNTPHAPNTQFKVAISNTEFIPAGTMIVAA